MATGAKDLQGLTDVGQGATNQPPFIPATLVATHLQQGNQGALDQMPLGVVFELMGQNLQRALAEMGWVAQN